MPKNSPLTRTILVIEDESSTYTLISDALCTGEHQIITAQDSETALQLVRQYRPDLIASITRYPNPMRTTCAVICGICRLRRAP